MPLRPLGADRAAPAVPALQEWIQDCTDERCMMGCSNDAGLRPLRVKCKRGSPSRLATEAVAWRGSGRPHPRRGWPDGERILLSLVINRDTDKASWEVAGRRGQHCRSSQSSLAGAAQLRLPALTADLRLDTAAKRAFDSLTQFASLTQLDPLPRLDSLPHLDPRSQLDSLTQFDLLALPPLGSPRQLASPPNPHPPPRSSASHLAAGVGPAAALARCIIRARLAASRLRSVGKPRARSSARYAAAALRSPAATRPTARRRGSLHRP